MRQPSPYDKKDWTSSLDSRRWVTNMVALLAIMLFALVGSQIIPSALGLPGADESARSGLVAAFLLNIALLLFAWRRSVDLQRACVARDIAEARARELAHIDDTTGLFNRRHLVGRIESLCRSEAELALVLIDLDHFKKVNDLYGHAAGDKLLGEVASKVRALSPRDACCARLGGDEFAILLRGQSAHDEEVTALAEDLLRELKRPIKLEHTMAHVGASIGLSIRDGTCERPETMLRRSDIAMYQAKAMGGNCVIWFDTEMEEELDRRNALETEIREGIATGQFVPYFQPLVDVETGDIKGLEVLARWEHPTRGILEPSEFIPIAEATGMISELSISVMHSALAIARDWPQHLTIAVNVSPIQFKDPLLDQRILKVLAETRFPAGRLELEVTESALLDDKVRALTIVESLKNQGVRISLDDFGTGYASLSHLRVLPFDRIKIDKSFVATLLDDPQSGAIVHAITTLAKSLNLPITAEGVESESVHQRLQELGCASMQGWLFGKAVTAAETAKLLLGETEVSPSSEGAPAQLPEIPHLKERRDFSRRARHA